MKILKSTLVILSIIGIFFIGLSIQKPFWQDDIYKNFVTEFPKEGEYVPYRLRKVIVGQWIVLKNISERTLTWIWFDKFYGIITITILYAFNKKKNIQIVLIITAVTLTIIELNPDTSTNFKYIIPTIINVFLP